VRRVVAVSFMSQVNTLVRGMGTAAASSPRPPPIRSARGFGYARTALVLMSASSRDAASSGGWRRGRHRWRRGFLCLRFGAQAGNDLLQARELL
jgi:hypothetical protein